MEDILHFVGKMVLITTGIAYVVLVAVALVYVLGGAMMFIICRKKVDCINDTCPFRDQCKKVAVITPKERKELQFMLEYIRVKEKFNELKEQNGAEQNEG